MGAFLKKKSSNLTPLPVAESTVGRQKVSRDTGIRVTFGHSERFCGASSMRNKYRGKERDVFRLDVGIGSIVFRDAGRKNQARKIMDEVQTASFWN